MVPQSSSKTSDAAPGDAEADALFNADPHFLEAAEDLENMRLASDSPAAAPESGGNQAAAPNAMELFERGSGAIEDWFVPLFVLDPDGIHGGDDRHGLVDFTY